MMKLKSLFEEKILNDVRSYAYGSHGILVEFHDAIYWNDGEYEGFDSYEEPDEAERLQWTGAKEVIYF